MKKLFALLLAGLMMLSFAACGTNDNPSGNEDNPGVSQTDNQNAKNYEWPTAEWIIDSMNYTGAGDIEVVQYRLEETEAADTERFTIRISNSNIDDVLAYAKALENDGFINSFGDQEPKANGNYSPRFGHLDLTQDIIIDYYAEPLSREMQDTEGRMIEHTYNLSIQLSNTKHK